MKVFVVGSLAYDRIMNFPGYFKDHIIPSKIHILNVSFHLEKYNEEFGGTAGNIAYNLALLGEQPVIFATAGNNFGKYKDWLRSKKVDVSKIKIVDRELTATAHIITDQSDNQITGFYAGAMKYPANPLPRSFRNKKAMGIVAPGNMEDMVKFPKLFKQYNIPYIFDPSMQIPRLSKQELISGIKGCSVLIGNDYEMQMLMKKTGLNKRVLLSQVPLVVTTKGPKGSVIDTAVQRFVIPPAQPANQSDPTGAGDAFRAGLIKGLINDYPLEKIGKLASTVAVYTVEKYGTQTHRFNWASVKKRYNKNFKENLR
ncbi:carbohydrate kinase family protein [Patescibacteria group bacterium]|nr:carbohydrate kinase family protein [Patescibacteria group bacterium]